MNFKSLLVFLSTTLMCGCTSIDQSNGGDKTNRTTEMPKPEIIKVFACSDHCPGPREQYLVEVYKGINNISDCKRVGGVPYEYFGWKKYFICKVR